MYYLLDSNSQYKGKSVELPTDEPYTDIEPIGCLDRHNLFFDAVTDSWVNVPMVFTVEEEAEYQSIKTTLDILNNKAQKEQELRDLVVTTASGTTFDGNETARNNILSALAASDILGVDSIEWKLADNSLKLVNISELREVLALAIQEVGNIVRRY